MIQISRESLKSLAGKYIWWKTPDEAVAMPDRVIAQVMNIGDYSDVQSLAAQVGDEALREVLTHAEAGQFNERSWAYWHYRLGLASVDHLPALPVRKIRMTRKFKPRMDVLSPAQQGLWPELRGAPKLGFTLYGGTAIALRLGHRDSVDFDFFSEKPLDREAIKAAFPFMAHSTTLQDQGNTWVVLVPHGNSGREHVKVSFFGTIAFGRVGEPDFTDDGVLQVASFDDLMATKVKVVLQRAEAKDYRDVAAMVNAGVSLSHGLASARQLYGSDFQPSESLKALVYFNDGDLKTLTAAEKDTLVEAVKAVRDLPRVALRSNSLSGLACDDLSEMNRADLRAHF